MTTRFTRAHDLVDQPCLKRDQRRCVIDRRQSNGAHFLDARIDERAHLHQRLALMLDLEDQPFDVMVAPVRTPECAQLGQRRGNEGG